jgi:hypothetical protein
MQQRDQSGFAQITADTIALRRIYADDFPASDRPVSYATRQRSSLTSQRMR